jgi:D-tyrosyl-tRNA(Tyr) deacylase
MRAVVQRVEKAQVSIESELIGAIGVGMLVLIAVESGDTKADLDYMKRKLITLRVFPDEAGRMNRSVADIGGEILLISQFTLFGDCRKGTRPSFSRAARPEQAEALYGRLADAIRATGIPVELGRFQAMMKVSLVNDGPVTLVIDSKKNFY